MILLASDHRGYEIKEEIKKYLQEKSLEYKDFGSYSEERVDYPEFAALVAKEVQKNGENRGILICGTGMGMSIVANKFRGIRCTLCHDEVTARFAKSHNNSNILAIGAENMLPSKAIAIVRVWLATEFDGGRHQERLEEIENIEKENFK